MSDDVSERVWNGPAALETFLVPVGDLDPFVGNPNRGDVEALRKSLRRFGQVFPVLADPTLAETGRLRIVARHHLVQAAQAEGWTHVAVVANDFGSEDEARAFLIADNRIASLSTVDEEALANQLAALNSFEATGYTETDRDELQARLSALRDQSPDFRRLDAPDFDPDDETAPPRLDERAATTGFFEVPLRLGPDDRRDFANLVKMLRVEWGLDDTTAVVLRAIRQAAQQT